ncbi:MAG: D-Ala-D-Ala carboxypeptidase family metallohydrolase [Oligoflexales bacterium]
MNQYLTRNFTRSELACLCCGECKMNHVFMDRLQVFRDLYGKPLTIVSGYRCMLHNRVVGGSPKSDHLRGEAVDIRVKDKNSNELYRLREIAFALKFNGIGFGKNQFHLGLRDGPAKSWAY